MEPGRTRRGHLYDVTVSEPPGADPQSFSDQETVSDGTDVEDDVSLEPGATLEGTVTGGGQPVSAAAVQVCADGTTDCVAVSTGQDGNWSADGLTGGTYDVTANPPAGTSLGVGRSSAVVTEGGEVELDVALPVPEPLPAGTTITSTGSYQGAPETGWGRTGQLEHPSLQQRGRIGRHLRLWA